MSEVRNPNPDTSANDGSPTDGETRLPLDVAPRVRDEKVDEDELFDRVVAWFKASRDHFAEWRNEATRCYDFVAGRQWDENDADILRDQGRPVVTFNRIGPFVDGVSGLEIGNRQSTQFFPRQLGAAGVNELLTGAAQWARDECDAEDEESEAFRDIIICGVGATQTRMDYSSEPDGMIAIERVDPLEFYPDPSSRKPNYDDSRFVIRIKDVPIPVAEEMFPGESTQDLHAQWAEDQPDDAESPHNARLAPYYRVDQAGEIDRNRQQCRLVEVEFWDYVKSYRVLDNSSGRFVRLTADDAKTYEMRARLLGRKPVMVADRSKKYYKAIIGGKVLTIMRGADYGGFTYKFMTGKRDRNRGYWYGIVSGMIDPQMWANKFFVQALHIVNVNAKGGLLAETDAFVDIEEARDAWADSDSIIELNPGGMEKVKQKDPPAFPMQINQMMETSLSAIPATAGINLEMIAQQSQQQAGVLEMQRKQQGMAVLAYIFDAKRRYQKEQGRLMLWMLKTFISDGRLIRIGGQDDAQYVPFVHEQGLFEYDVVVDDAPSSPNMKERVWSMIMQMLPVLKGLPPQAMAEMLKYSPFPTSLVQKISGMMQQPQQNPEMQAKAALTQAQAQKAQADAARIQAEVGHTQAKSQKLQAETQSIPTRNALDTNEQQARIEKMRADAINQLQNAGIMANDQQFQRVKDAVDALLQAHSQALDAQSQGHQQALDTQGQMHDQAMAQAQHALAVQQAMNPPEPAGPANQGD